MGRVNHGPLTLQKHLLGLLTLPAFRIRTYEKGACIGQKHVHFSIQRDSGDVDTHTDSFPFPDTLSPQQEQ